MPNPKFKKRSPDAHQCIRVEQIEVGKEYTFSINPERGVVSFDALTTEREVLNVIKDTRIIANKMVNKYYLITELSSKGRVHFHGVVNITNRYKFIMHDLPLWRKFGTYEVDVISNHDIWYTYMTKCISIFAEATQYYTDVVTRKKFNIMEEIIVTTFDATDKVTYMKRISDSQKECKNVEVLLPEIKPLDKVVRLNYNEYYKMYEEESDYE